MSLVIDVALEPENGLATPVSGGSLITETIYYYRVAAVTERGETCACASFNGTATSPNLTLDLTWDAVAGVKAVGGYKIYRNTSDVWTSGNHLLATVNTNSYTDDGTVGLTSGLPMKFTCTRITSIPTEKRSIIPNVPTIGSEGASQQYLGGFPEGIHVEGYLRGATAKTELDKLGAIRQAGLPCTFTYTALTVTLVNGTYLILALSYWPEAGTPNDADALMLRFTLDVIEAT